MKHITTKSLHCILLTGCVLAETTTRVIDLSYNHNLDADALKMAIPRDVSPLYVDVSSTALGDDGVNEILQDILGKVESDASLISQTNLVSPKGATRLIQTLLNTTCVEHLDLSWNPLHTEATGLKSFHAALEQLLGNSTHCPSTLTFDRCGLGPAACRAIGKGLIHRYTHQKEEEVHKPLSLSLCGNPATGDAGAAALAAALRFVATSGGNSKIIFDKLDLSACDIGDAGVEAIALALETSSCCLVRCLDLSNNRITERGAESLSRALATAANEQGENEPLLHSLDLSHNPIGDIGAKSLASCLVQKEIVPNLLLRSCHIHADGATALGKALRAFSSNLEGKQHKLSLDLSGNPFGVLRGKKKDDGKYSASRLKSKASATAAAYMNQGFSFLKKGLKDVGVEMGPATDDSDEEDEDDQLSSDSSLLSGEVDSSRLRCGGRALAEAFANAEDDKTKTPLTTGREIWLGLRHCYFDHAAADALANLKVIGKDDMGVEVDLDVRLNHVLEDEMISALHGEDDDKLREMAETHDEKMFVIRDAHARAREAAQAAAARVEAESAFNDSWDAPGGLSYSSDEEYDSSGDSQY